MTIKCIPIKEVYFDSVSGFRVLACEPLENNMDVKMNKYGNFTVSGSNINFKLKVPILLELQEKEDSKYEGEYSCVGYGGVEIANETITIPQEQEESILRQFMTKGQANNVLKAYPNFVEMILNGKAEEIKVDKIHNVGDFRFSEYVKKIEDNCDLIFFNKECWKFGINKEADIDRIRKRFKKAEQFVESFNKNPYGTMCDELGFGFEKIDHIVLNSFPELENSKIRCKYFCIDMLKMVELSGDTKINPNVISRYIKEYLPELFPHVVDVIKNDERFYYDNKTKFCSLRHTWRQEVNIAEHIKHRLEKDKTVGKCNKNFIEQFRELGVMNLTDEQMRILEIMDTGNIAVLTGPGGCVDCDTEFFTGYGWKRIADYTRGDKVLQYNENGTAKLVDPVQYVKKPCNNLWHFETKYGCNQTLCDEHRIVYWSQKGKQHECNIKDIIKKQSVPNINGWEGRFKTTFNYGGKGISLTDAEIKVMCAVICDGNFPQKRTNNYCRFHIKKDRKKERLRKIFTEANIKWTEAISAAEGYTDFYIYAPRQEKEFTEYWYNCNNRQLQVICDNILFWDGNINKTKTGKERKRFSTNVKTTAEFIQFAYTACGYRATINIRDRSGQKYLTCGKWYTRKSVEYTVNITDRTFIGLCSDCRDGHKKTQIVQVPTADGFKYCFTVPSGMLVLRRESCIFITGNCGKSASTKALIRMLEEKNKSYTLLAPTGVASKVLRQMTGRRTSTIHMLLACQGLVGEYVIIDEFSMVSVSLLSALFDYIGKNRKIVFVCDENQLPSIGAGNVIHDIISANVVPTAKLTKVFRYKSSGIVTNVTDVRNGQFNNAEKEYSDFNFIQASSNITEQILKQYQHYLDMGYKKEDILILSPFRVTDSGSHAINNIIQKKYNNHPETEAKIKVDGFDVYFKIGDRVINTKNNYHMLKWDIESGGYEFYEDEKGEIFYEEMPVYNGDLGNVVDVRNDEEGKIQVIVEWSEGIGCVEGPKIHDLLLGYCISIHKSQSAQAKCVIVVINRKGRDNFINRNILYTGLSRAQEQLSVIANQDIIENALKLQANLTRETWLEELLKSIN